MVSWQNFQIASTWIVPPIGHQDSGVRISTLQTPWGYDTLVLGGEQNGISNVDLSLEEALRTHSFWINYHVGNKDILDEQAATEEDAG